MRKWKYVIVAIILAADVLLFAALSGQTATPLLSRLLPSLGLANDSQLSGWLMLVLALLFILGLAVCTRWIFKDVADWVKESVSGDSEPAGAGE